jgi:hypothetical protein
MGRVLRERERGGRVTGGAGAGCSLRGASCSVVPAHPTPVLRPSTRARPRPRHRHLERARHTLSYTRTRKLRTSHQHPLESSSSQYGGTLQLVLQNGRAFFPATFRQHPSPFLTIRYNPSPSLSVTARQHNTGVADSQDSSTKVAVTAVGDARPNPLAHKKMLAPL